MIRLTSFLFSSQILFFIKESKGGRQLTKLSRAHKLGTDKLEQAKEI